MFRRGKKAKTDFKPVVVDEGSQEDPALRELTRRLNGDVELAKRIASLQQRYPNGTMIELMVYDWLVRHPEWQFIYQATLYGAPRGASGLPLVPDFVIWVDASRGIAIQVQGEYWHTLPGRREKDAAHALLTIGQRVQGVRIEQLVNVWEPHIMNDLDGVMRRAVAGIEIPL